MRILVLGYGNIGFVVGADLAERMPSTEIVISGRHLHRVETAVAEIRRARSRNVTGIQLDASNYHELSNAMKSFDLAVGALPGKLGYQSMAAAIEAKINFVDVSFMPENPLDLNEGAEEAGVTVIPDCGVAPGLSNLLVGHCASLLDEIESVKIMVGGLPELPVPPFGYSSNWSIEGLIDEYTRRARVVQDRAIIEVEALTGLEEIDFPGVGKLEAFYTDGLRTLLYSFRNVQTMWEKTLRYPGHAEKIKLLKWLGFFDERKVQLEKVSLSPRLLTERLMEEKLSRPDINDIVAMKVEVNGKASGSTRQYVYHLLDRFDVQSGTTAMARTTGYPTSIVSQLLAQNAVGENGVLPLENLATNKSLFTDIVDELEKRQIRIVETVSQKDA